MEPLILTNEDCRKAAWVMARQVEKAEVQNRIYGVPRGGVPVAYLLAKEASGSHVMDSAKDATVIVDDIIDTGATKRRYPSHPFLALVDYLPKGMRGLGQWVVFPWEKTDTKDSSADDIVTRLLQYIGEDPSREGLAETPQRVLRAWKEWTSGYGKNPEEILKCFTDGGERYDEMVVVKDLPFYSTCEHHLAPFFGTATIAYIPDKRVVGLSKLGRILEVFAKRLQIQERLTTDIADALQDNLSPKGVGVMIKARHLCMESRGYSHQGHHTITSCLRGALFVDPRARNEFLSISK